MARILIIDDDEIVCNGVKSILEKEGYEVDTSLSGVSGIEKVKNADYDLIYLDIHMPGMNGLETFRNIRAIKENAKVCIITAMSDDKMTEYLLLIREGAVDKIVRKPVFKDMLLKTTRGLLGIESGRKKILVIDDDELIRDAFKTVLKEFNFEIDFAKTAKEAMDLFNSKAYHLIYMDLQLPDKDGNDLLKEMREINKDIKICVMSGYLSKLGNLMELRDKAAGNIMFCMKPLSRREIIEITKNSIFS
jgi:two-component system, NtrC family, response regulator HydG